MRKSLLLLSMVTFETTANIFSLRSVWKSPEVMKGQRTWRNVIFLQKGVSVSEPHIGSNSK